MSNRTIDIVNIVPGNFCNLRCRHCVNESGPDRSDRLNADEIQNIAQELNLLKPALIILTGGEPTLHVDSINEILKKLSYSGFEVQITTNGWFAKSAEKLESILSSFHRLHRVQLSFDVFHGSRLTIEDAQRLVEACSKKSIKFNVTMCLSSAADLIEADKISKQLGTQIVFQKVASIGRARSTGAEFKQPRFDRAVLEEKCANLNTLTYVHGKGFTFCCGPLVFETNAPVAHQSIEAHMKSDLRRKFESKNFGELLRDAGGTEAELTPAMSHPCALCHHIQRRGQCAKSS